MNNDGKLTETFGVVSVDLIPRAQLITIISVNITSTVIFPRVPLEPIIIYLISD